MSKDYPLANYRPYGNTRNPYGQKIRDFAAATLLADDATEQHKGQWRERFGLPPTAFLQLELGAYHGETSIHLAKTQPEVAHLGVEWKYKQCFKAGKKAADVGVKNLTFLRANMARLARVVAPGEVDRIWVLFPDPWSKASQQKWRVLNPGFFRLLASLLKEGKELMIKTDHQDYAEYIQTAWQEAGGFELMNKEDAEKVWALIPPTPFERIFLRQKLPIYSFALRRNGDLIVAPMEAEHVAALPV